MQRRPKGDRGLPDVPPPLDYPLPSNKLWTVSPESTEPVAEPSSASQGPSEAPCESTRLDARPTSGSGHRSRSPSQYMLPDVNALIEHFLQEGRLCFDDALMLVNRVTPIFRGEPNILRLGSKVVQASLPPSASGTPHNATAGATVPPLSSLHGSNELSVEYQSSSPTSAWEGSEEPSARGLSAVGPGGRRLSDTLQPGMTRESTSSATNSVNTAHYIDVTVVGDVHGQYYDLINMLRNVSTRQPFLKHKYLFLGDYVDRGCFSTEIILTLFAWKICHPTTLFMLRGNHECRQLTTYFNFKDECRYKYNMQFYDAVMNCFDALPLAAVLNDTFLCVHGGLSPNIRSVEDIALLERHSEVPTQGIFCDLLWADPMDEEEEELCPFALFLQNELRGCSYVFSHSAVTSFLQNNGLTALVRAHEAQDEGFKLYRKVDSTGYPAVICIFSAPNYCDAYNNKGAIMEVDGTRQTIAIRQFESVAHPYYLPNFMEAFQWSFGFLVDKIEEAFHGMFAYTQDTQPGIRVAHPAGIRSTNVLTDQAEGKDLGSPCESVLFQSLLSTMFVRKNRTKKGSWVLRSVLVRRHGRVIKAKIMAVVKFRMLLRQLRAPTLSVSGNKSRSGSERKKIVGVASPGEAQTVSPARSPAKRSPPIPFHTDPARGTTGPISTSSPIPFDSGDRQQDMDSHHPGQASFTGPQSVGSVPRPGGLMKRKQSRS